MPLANLTNRKESDWLKRLRKPKTDERKQRAVPVRRKKNQDEESDTGHIINRGIIGMYFGEMLPKQKDGAKHVQNAASYEPGRENQALLKNRHAFTHIPGTSIYGEKAYIKKPFLRNGIKSVHPSDAPQKYGGRLLRPQTNDGSRTLVGIYSENQKRSIAREAKRKVEYDQTRKDRLSEGQLLVEKLKKEKQEFSLFNYGGPGGSGWRNDRGPVKAHINQPPEELWEKIKELEKHKLDSSNYFLVHRGRKLRRGIPLRKQGVRGNCRCGYETILICPAPEDITEVLEHWVDCVFVPADTTGTAMYDYRDDLDIPGSLAQQQIELHRLF